MLTLKEMSLEDIDGILEVEEECFRTPWSKHSFEMELKNGAARYLVAKEDGKVVGYGGTWLIIDEAHVTNIAVRESFRGKNIGSEILSKLIEICKAESWTSFEAQLFLLLGISLQI